jgi:HEAT repeat protein
MQAIESCLTADNSPAIRFAAARLGLTKGSKAAIDYLRENLDNLTAEQRASAAYRLDRLDTETAMPLLQQLLRDTSRNVREGALRMCFDEGHAALGIPAAFDALLAPDSQIGVDEIAQYPFWSCFDRPSDRQQIRQTPEARKRRAAMSCACLLGRLLGG